MKDDCHILNPLQRDGVSQRQRLVRALHPSYVSVDERDLKDHLLYARKYARLLRYYSSQNNADGDWQLFIENDISTLTAIIADTDLPQHRATFEQKITEINALPLANRWSEIAELFQLTFALPIMANKWITSALEGLQLHTELQKIIGAVMNDTLIQVYGMVQRSNSLPPALNVGNINYPAVTQFSSPWDLAAIQPDLSYFPNINAPTEADLEILIDALRKAYKKLYDSLLSIVNRGDQFLEETLTNYPEHTPHITLFLAFICIFKIAGNHLNTFTRRHLNFYYREVLGLQPKPAEPDAAHIVFKLAKNFETHRVAAQTPLKAGKDDNGTNITFETDEELIVNKVAIAENGLKSVFLEKELLANGEYQVNNIYAAPIANSADGLGADIEAEDGKWLAFGNAAMPEATVGFAIASPIFLLKEGERTITMTLHFDKENPALWNAIYNNDATVNQELVKNLTVFYSGEKAWEAIDIDTITVNLAGGNTINITLTLTLPAGAAPFTYFNHEVLQDGFATNHPVLKIVMDSVGGISPYRYFQQLNLTSLDLKVDVQGMTDLILENDIGTLNPAKPFQPFGPIPKVGSKFYIGNFEVFQKALNCNANDLSLSIEWADLPLVNFPKHYENYIKISEVTNDDVFQVQPEKLENGIWTNFGCKKSMFANNPKVKVPVTSTPPTVINTSPLTFNGIHTTRAINLPNFKSLTPYLQRGFFRFTLTKDFLHKDFAPSLTTAVINKTSIPNEPYTPTIASIKLNYCSTQSIDFQNQSKADYPDRVEQLFHIEPFGWKEFFPVPNATSDKEIFVSQKIVPEFKVSVKNAATNNISETDAEGSFFIGLTGLEPQQNVSILFQVAEGSADPELATQPVIWSFLSHNRWMDFATRDILSDTTNGLLQSGIIKFVMPKTMSDDATRLPDSTFWIKAAVANHTAAVSKIIAVIPQAVKATFASVPDNDLNRLSRALSAQTIAKLENRQAAIKKVEQPFASFGGKIAERIEAPADVSGEAVFDKEYNEFYIRISERLRHKKRGVTMWDYERLVLQQFPDIYKVKCINHTQLGLPDICSPEHSPGHVKVIVLPNLRNKNAVDPLRPMVSKNQLENIRLFLQRHISDFVYLEVRNPVFERVQVDFEVQFWEGFDKGFYTQQLQQDILKFLSPWLYDEGQDLAVGGKIHRSTIINFIEETAYVDFLTDFKMNQLVVQEDGTEITKYDVEEAVATTSSSVLVSVPATEHLIGDNIVVNCLT